MDVRALIIQAWIIQSFLRNRANACVSAEYVRIGFAVFPEVLAIRISNELRVTNATCYFSATSFYY